MKMGVGFCLSLCNHSAFSKSGETFLVSPSFRSQLTLETSRRSFLLMDFGWDQCGLVAAAWYCRTHTMLFLSILSAVAWSSHFVRVWIKATVPNFHSRVKAKEGYSTN